MQTPQSNSDRIRREKQRRAFAWLLLHAGFAAGLLFAAEGAITATRGQTLATGIILIERK